MYHALPINLSPGTTRHALTVTSNPTTRTSSSRTTTKGSSSSSEKTKDSSSKNALPPTGLQTSTHRHALERNIGHVPVPLVLKQEDDHRNHRSANASEVSVAVAEKLITTKKDQHRDDRIGTSAVHSPAIGSSDVSDNVQHLGITSAGTTLIETTQAKTTVATTAAVTAADKEQTYYTDPDTDGIAAKGTISPTPKFH